MNRSFVILAFVILCWLFYTSCSYQAPYQAIRTKGPVGVELNNGKFIPGNAVSVEGFFGRGTVAIGKDTFRKKNVFTFVQDSVKFIKMGLGPMKNEFGYQIIGGDIDVYRARGFDAMAKGGTEDIMPLTVYNASNFIHQGDAGFLEYKNASSLQKGSNALLAVGITSLSVAPLLAVIGLTNDLFSSSVSSTSQDLFIGALASLIVGTVTLPLGISLHINSKKHLYRAIEDYNNRKDE